MAELIFDVVVDGSGNANPAARTRGGHRIITEEAGLRTFWTVDADEPVLAT